MVGRPRSVSNVPSERVRPAAQGARDFFRPEVEIESAPRLKVRRSGRRDESGVALRALVGYAASMTGDDLRHTRTEDPARLATRAKPGRMLRTPLSLRETFPAYAACA